VFTVGLTGQNGFNSCRARDFSQPAGGYTFGVCPAGDTADPVCSVDPGSVAKVIDTIPPPGVSQASEWTGSTGAAVLQGVTVP